MGCPLENLVGSLELTVLLLERLHLFRVVGADPRHVALVNVSLTHPGAHRLGAVPQLLSNALDRPVLGTELGTQRPDHPHRSGLLFEAVATRGRLPRGGVLRHESILVSKRWRLQLTQGDSLQALDAHQGHRVLEVGTGTGYNAALLCHRLGPDNVTSIDIDTGLVDRARERLAAFDYFPHLEATDGAAGC